MGFSKFLFTRRELFLTLSSYVSFLAFSNGSALEENTSKSGEDNITVPKKEYISGDRYYEERKYKNFVITVGQDSTSEIQGKTEKAIQAGVDYIARFGGGTVKVKNGIYEFSNSLFLHSGVRIVGEGEEVIFRKNRAKESKLIKESDWYETYVTVSDAELFHIGEGVCIQTKNPHTGGRVVIKRTIVDIENEKLILDKPLRENVWSMEDTKISTLFPLISGEFIRDVLIENIKLDGNKEENPFLDGNYAGCIWLQDCNSIVIRKVEARNYNGDGISWQIVHDLTIENCYSHHNTGLGLHPGSGSQRARILNSRIQNNDVGIFFCWGAKYGLVENCEIFNNRIGISIGHSDNHNVIRNNTIKDSSQRAVLFRIEDDRFVATGNVVENNKIENLHDPSGVAISLEGATTGNSIVSNDIVDSLGTHNKVGILISKRAKDNIINGNRITGFYKDILEE